MLTCAFGWVLQAACLPVEAQGIPTAARAEYCVFLLVLVVAMVAALLMAMALE
jgi:hypothetical protein